MSIATKDDFKNFVQATESISGYRKPVAFGICKADLSQKDPNKTLQAKFLHLNCNENYGSAAAIVQGIAGNELEGSTLLSDIGSKNSVVVELEEMHIQAVLSNFSPYLSEALTDKSSHQNIQQFLSIEKNPNAIYRAVFIYDLNVAPASVEDVYLRLYLYSTGKMPLRSINMDGAFGILHNVAWTIDGTPYDLDWLNENRMDMIVFDEWPDIDSVDKFPRMLQHVLPIVADDGSHRTRILSSDKVRMGAQLAPGTTIMPGASYVNFNAGTEGASMVEGRISSSAKIGEGTDVGGGASILGVLSGGNSEPITIGKNCLLGANSVTGISYGDGCIIDAGVSILAGTKVSMSEDTYENLKSVNPNMPEKDSFGFENGETKCKASQLSGLNGLHFRSHSIKGTIEVYKSGRTIELNAELH